MKDQEIIEDSWVLNFKDLPMMTTEAEEEIMRESKLPKCACGNEAKFVVIGFSSYSAFCNECKGKK